jgi:hypothetical protein
VNIRLGVYSYPPGYRHCRGPRSNYLEAKPVDGPSIYYHFYEARMRFGSSVEDFSKWIEDEIEVTSLVQRGGLISAGKKVLKAQNQ